MLRNIKWAIIFFLLLSALPASAATWYVNCSSGAAKNQAGYGTSEAFPWKNITYASTMSAVGDTVLVYPGTYNTATGESFVSSITITGRYFKSTTTGLATIDAAGSTVHALTLGNNTTLEGFTIKRNGTTNTIYCVNVNGSNVQLINNYIIQTGASGNYIRAVYLTAAADNCLLDGNTISALRGETVYLASGADNPTIRNNTISNTTSTPNTTYGYGYGIRMYGNANAQIINNAVNANVGLAQESNCANSLIRGNRFLSYSTDTDAWTGIFAYGYGEITSNEVRGFGSSTYAGIYCNSGGPFILNKNTVVGCLYGIRLLADATLKNNIIAAGPGPHKLYDLSAGIYQTSGQVISTYNDVYNNVTNYYGTILDRSHDITSYPRFVSVDNNDYRLYSDSPCAGTADDGGNRGAYETMAGTSGILNASYVKSTGDDTKSGTDEANAWKTIRRALSSTEGTVNVVAGSSWTLTAADLPINLSNGQTLHATGAATIDSTTAAGHTIIMGLNTTLEGLTIKKSVTTTGNYCVFVRGTNAQVRNNTLIQSGGSGNQIRALYITGSGATNTFGDNCLVEGNNLSAGRGEVVYLESGADYPIIRNNVINHTYNGAPSDTYGYGIRLAGSLSPVIQGNTITSNGGICQVGACANSLIRGNKIIAYNTDVSAYYGMEVNGYGEVTSNEVRGYRNSTYGAIYAYSSGNHIINRNTIVNNLQGIRVGSTVAENTNATIKNNIISGGTSLEGYLDESIGIYNLGIGKAASTYNDLFNNETDYSGTISDKSNDLTSYPRFVNVPGNDYRIYNDSPCHNTADDGGNRGAYETAAGTSGVLNVSYVKSTGDDTKNGTDEANAWKTLSHALSSTEGTVNVVAGSSWTLTAADLPLNLSEGQTLHATGAATIDSTTATGHTIIMGNNTTLEGLTIKKSVTATGNYCLLVSGSNAQVRNNTLIQSGGSGNQIRALYISGSSTNATGDNCLVEGNNLSAGRGEVVYLESGADYPIIRNNVINHTYNGAPSDTYGYGIRLAGSLSPVIQGNTITSNGGICQVGACANSLIRGNKIIAYNTDVSAYYGMEVNGYGEVTSNEVRGYRNSTYGAIYAYSSGNHIINRNTIVNNLQGIRVGSTVAENTNATIKNNIISGGTSLEGYLDESIGIYNLGIGKAASTYNDLFNNETDYSGTISDKSNDLTSYPKFVNVPGNDYRIYNDSPCHNTADDGKDRGAYQAADTNSGILAISYVKSTGDDTMSGTDEANAWKTLSHALSSTEGTVNVVAGSSWTLTAADLPLNLADGQKLVATGAATIDSTTATGHTIIMGNNTTLEGLTIKKSVTTGDIYCVAVQGSGAQIRNNYLTQSGASGNTLRALYVSGSGHNCLIRGNTISSGRGEPVVIAANALSPVIRSNIINHTYAGSPSSIYGYGINLAGGNSNALIEGNTITSNVAINQAAFSANILIRNNKIIANTADSYAWYGMYLNGYGEVTSNEVRGYRDSATYGGIVCAAGGPFTLNRNTIVKSVLGIRSAVDAALKNNIISAAAKTNGFYNESYGIYQTGGVVTSQNNDLFHTEYPYSGTVYWQINDLNKCPRFVNPDTDDYRLFTDSPCINAAEDGGNLGAYESNSTSSGILSNSYVKPDGNDSTGDGASTDTAWKTITRALASTEGTVNVQAGTYTTGETFPITIGAGQTLISIADPVTTATIDAISSVTTDTVQMANDATLEGLSVKSASATDGKYVLSLLGARARVKNSYIAHNGSGASSYPIALDATADDCRLEGNTISGVRRQGINLAAGATGGIFKNNNISISNSDSAHTYAITIGNGCNNSWLENNTITNTCNLVNASYYHYGINLDATSTGLTIKSNKVIGAGTTATGRGIYLAGGTGDISSNEVRSCGNYGIYVNCISGTVTITKNTVAKCMFGITGAGAGTKTVKNNVVEGEVGGKSYTSGKGLDNDTANNYFVSTYNLIYANDITYEGTVYDKTGDITTKDAVFTDATNDDYHLQASSPCIDSGTPAGVDRGCYDYDLPPLTVSVLGPNGGEGILFGTWYNITWETTAYPTSINIYYSGDNGASYSSLALGEANDGVYPWYVNQDPNSQAKIKIEALQNGSIATDESNAAFTIQPISYYVNCATGVNSANGGRGTSEALPWKTITYAATMAATGSTTYVAPGTYNAGTGEVFPAAGLAITGRKFMSSTTSLATIDSGTANVNTLALTANATLDGFTIKSAPASTSVAYYTIYVNGNNINLFNNIINCTGAYNTDRAIYASASGDYLYLYGNTVNTGSTPYRTIDLASGADYPVFWNNTITCANAVDSYGFGIYIAASNAPSLEGNTITANKGIAQAAACNNMIIRSNKIAANTSSTVAHYGLALRGYGLVEKNEIRGYIGSGTDGAAILLADSSTGPFIINKNSIAKNLYAVRLWSGYTGIATVKNNIISAAGLGEFMDGSIGIVREGGTVTSQYNTYYNNENKYSGTVGDKSNDTSDCPRFANWTSNDYGLGSDSPCLGTADDGGNRGAYDSTGTESGVLTNSYVKSTGSDSDTGTEEAHAWKTIKKGLSNTDGTVNVLAGTYNAGNGENFPIYIGAGQILKAATTEAVIDSGASGVNSVVMGNDTTLEGFTVIKANDTVSWRYCVEVQGQNARIANNILTNNQTSSYSDCGVLYINATGSNARVEGNTLNGASYTYYGLYLVAGAGDVMIRNNSVTNPRNGVASTYGINANGNNNLLIEGNAITCNKGILMTAACSNFSIKGNKVVAYNADASNAHGMVLRGYGDVTSNEVRGFQTAAYGGIYCVDGGPFNLNKNTLVKNVVGIRANVDTLIKNNIISAAPALNSFYDESYGIVCGGGTVTSRYNHIYNNEYNYSGTIGDRTQDLDSYPEFVDIINNDYRFFNDSPCKGTADDGGNRGAYDSTGTESGVLTNSYVKSTGSDSDTGTEEAHAWKTIKKGLSNTDGTVNVLAGTYNAGNGENFPIYIGAGQILKAATTEAVIDSGASGVNSVVMGNDTTLEGFTVIKANDTVSWRYCVEVQGQNARIANNILTNNQTSSYSDCGVLYINATGSNARVEGNTLNGASYTYYGLYLVAGAGDVMIRNNSVTNPRNGVASTYGINANGNSNLLIEGNAITCNKGILMTAACSNFSIKGNKVVAYNADASNAHGMVLRGYGDVTSNEVRGFQTAAYGGIYCIEGGPYTLNRNTLVKNVVGIRAAVDTTIKNNIISAAPTPNEFYDESYGIIQNSGTVNSSYNDLFNNEYNYYGTVGNQANDLTSYPRFVSAVGNDYRIYVDSPCRNTADDGGNRGAYEALESTSGVLNVSYVKPTGDDTDTGTDEAHAWKTITKALASTEGTVNVLAGTYLTGEVFPLKLSNNQVLRSIASPSTTATIDSSGVTNQYTIVMGNSSTLDGFTVNDATTAAAGYYTIYVSAPNADLRNNVLNYRSGQANGGVVYVDASGDYVDLQGNTLNGSATSYYVLYLASGADYPVIKDNVINQNLTTYNGRGIYMDGSYSSLIQRNIITADRGIAQATACGNMYIEGNKIKALTADSNAEYGMKLTGYGTVVSNEVRGYSVATVGAGIYAYGGGPFTINRNTIVKNLYGLRTDVDLTAKNNIISAAPSPNDSLAGSRGIMQSTGTLTSTYNDLYNNETNYFGTVNNQSNDITSCPRFVDSNNNDYRLASNSPCVGTADDGGNRGAYGSSGTPGGIENSYVSTSGNDSDTGVDQAHAWRTLTKSLAYTESTINVLAGTYNAGEIFPLTVGSGQKLRSAATPSSSATIDSTAVRVVQLRQNATIEGMSIHTTSGSNTDGAVYLLGKAYVSNNTITCEAADCNGVFMPDAADGGEARGNTIWTGGASGKGIKVDTTCDNVIIDGNIITAGYYGVVLYHQNNGFLINGNKIMAATQGNGYGVKGGDYDVTSNYTYSGSITSNEVRGFRAGMYLKANSPSVVTVTYNTLVKNGNATAPQGGIYLTYASANGGTFNLRNNIVAQEVGGYTFTGTSGITRYTSTYPTVSSKYNDVYANDTNWGNSIASGEGDKSSDALFVDANNNDFHLKTGSPCISAGTPEGVDLGCYDYEGPCSITLRSPNGGETWNSYTWRNITWESSGYTGLIDVYYSINSGGNYTLIAAGEADDGVYPWYVPFVATTEAKVKVVANGVDTVTSESAGTFTIYIPPPPSITSIDPTSVQNNQTSVNMIITGEAFQSGAAVKLSQSGEPDINPVSTNLVNTSRIDCNFNLQDKKAGTWILRVTNPDTQYGTFEGLTISNAPPVPGSIDPVSGTTAGGTKVTISGTQFLRADYRRAISVSNEGSALSDYQVLVTMNTAALVSLGKMLSDCGDVRFYDSDQVTPLSFWLESGANTSSTRFWVKVPTLDAAASKNIYVTYGNPNLTSAGNLGATMLRTISNLQGSWGLDETSGINVADGSGNGLDGSANGASIVDGKFGKARSFNGSSDYVGVAYNAKLAPASQLAIDCWAYNSNWATYTSVASLISKTQNGGYNIEMNSSGQEGSTSIAALVWRNGNYGVPKASRSGLSAGWHHFTGLYDGRYARFFVDGTLMQTNDAGASYPITYANSNSLILGAEVGIGAVPEGNYFTGYIDEAHVFSNALTTEEVQDLAANYGFTNASYPNQLLIRKRAAVEPVSTIGTIETGNLTKVFFGDTQAAASLYVNYTTVTATTPAHAAGLVNVTVQNPDGQMATLEGAYTFITPSNPNPTSIIPNQGPNTGEVSVVIYGTDFKTSGTTTVELTRSGAAAVAGTGISVVGTSEIQCNFDLTGRVAGAWNVVVTNPDTLTGTLANGFTITGPPPTVVSLSPDEGRTAGGTGVTITGANYQPSDYRREISITNSGSQLDNYQINFTLDTSALISAGKMRSDGGDLRFYDSNGTSPLNYWVESGLNTSTTKIWVKVTTIEAVATKTIYLGYGNSSLTSESSGAGVLLSFDDFDNGSIDSQWTLLSGNGTISESGGALNFNYIGSEGNDWWSSVTRQEKILKLNDLPSGDFQAQVKLLNYTSPDYSNAGMAVYNNDTSAHVLSSSDGGGSPYFENVNWGGSPQSTYGGSYSLPRYMAIRRIGSYYSFYLSTDGSSWDKVGIDYNSITFNNIVLFGKEWSGNNLVFSMDDFWVKKYAATDPSVSVGSETGNPLKVYFETSSATNVTYVNSTTITATAPAHAAGAVSVTVKNPDGAIGTLEVAFTYNSAPAVTSIDPSTGVNTGEITVTIYGTAFKTSGTTAVRLTKTGTADVTATGVSVFSDTQLSATFDLSGRKVGAWNVVVTNPDGQTGTRSSGFNVVYPAPIISRVTPESGSTDGGTLVTIEGTGFVQSYNFRRAVNLSNSGSALSDYQVPITLDTAALIAAGKMNADGSDLRFYDSDGSTALSFWLESGINTTSTRIWVKVPTLEASSAKTIYLSYGDPTLGSASAGENTFDFFDDFLTKDTSKFTYDETFGGSNCILYTLEAGALKEHSDNAWRILRMKKDFAPSATGIICSRFKPSASCQWHSNMLVQSDNVNYSRFGIYQPSSMVMRQQYVVTGGYTFPQDMFTAVAGTWYKAEIIKKASDTFQMKTYNDDWTLNNSYQTNQSAWSGVTWTWVNWQYENVDVYYDYVFVRKYAATEPSVTVSDTETGNILRSLFGASIPTSTTYQSSTTIEVVTGPVADPGAVDVTVINPDSQIGTLESAFTFTKPAVRLFSPNGGEIWKAGTWHDITWEAINNPSAINLYLITSESVGYQSITSEAENDGTYSWLVPNLASSECKVRIEAVSSEGTATDESNSAFTITAATDFYVNAATGSNTYNGLTSEVVVGTSNGPWKTLTYASTAAPSGSTVHAAAGTYDAALGESFPINVTGRKFIATGSTTIDSTNARVVDLNTNGTLEGFVVKTTAASSGNGAVHLLGKGYVFSNTIDNSSGSSGGGIVLVDAADGSQIKNNSIKTGSSSSGIYLNDYCIDVATEGNTLEVGSNGTGIRYGYNSNNYVIRNNLVKGPGMASGTGIYGIAIYNGTIASNEVRDFSIGIDWSVYDSNYTAVISNNTLVKSTTGIYCREYSFAAKYTVKNNIVSASPQLGTYATGTYGIRKNGSTNVTLSYNDVWNNAANYENLTAGTGDIAQYPRFISPEASDYSIGTDSPCATGGEGGTYMGRYAPSGISAVSSESWVDDDGSDDNDGSETSPLRTIKKALGRTTDTIHVKTGTYSAGETFPLAMSTGQYLKSEAAPSQLATIEATTAQVVVLAPNTTVEGFTIKTTAASSGNGAVHLLGKGYVFSNTIDNSSGSSGGGIVLVDAADYSQIKNNYVKTGSSSTGIYLNDYCSDVITEGNTCEVGSNGYGIRYGYASNNYTIRNNLVKGPGMASGTGIYGIPVFNGTVASNEVRDFSIGIDWSVYDSNYTAVISNNTLVKSTTGIYCREYSWAPKYTVKNNIISASPQLGTFTAGTYGIRKTGSANVTLSYNDIWNNAANYETLTAGTGDIAQYPRFISPEAGDYSIGADSPCATGGEGGTYIGRYPASGPSPATSESWVDASAGDDSMQYGLEGTPWKTIKKAIGLTTGTIHIQAGTYSAGETYPLTPSEGQVLGSESIAQKLVTLEATTSRIISLLPNTTIEGFTLKTTASDTSNGVIHCLGKGFIYNNVIDNTAGSNGRGIYLLAASDGSQIQNNYLKTGASGVGIYADSGCDDVVAEGSTFEVAANGYGIYFNQANNITFRNNQFVGAGSGTGIWANSYNGSLSSNEVRSFNVGVDWGVWNSSYAVNIYNNTLIRNTYGINCRLFYDYWGIYNIKNNILSANPQLGNYTAGTYGIYKSNANMTVNSTYNDIWNNATNYYLCSAGTGDINKYPRFISPETHDYEIGSDSPCATGGEGSTYMGKYPPLGTASSITSESYVSSSLGDDGRSVSSPDAPWKTITYALTKTDSNINVLAGTYNKSSNNETFPIRLLGGQKLVKYGTGYATIEADGASQNQHSAEMTSDTTLEGLELINRSASNYVYPIYVNGARVRLKNDRMKYLGSAFYSFAVGVGEPGDYLTVENCTLESDTETTLFFSAGNDYPLVKNNTITNNNTSNAGAIRFYGSSLSPTLEGNTITTARHGIYEDRAELSNQVVKNNQVIGSGNSTYYGMFLYGPGTISSNEVRGFKDAGGAAIYTNYVSSGNLTLDHNTLAKNTIGVKAATTTIVKNSIIASEVGGYSASGTKGIYQVGGTVNSLYNNIYANDATYEGSVGDKTGDLQTDPLFVDATGNDYHLQSGSPCISSATPEGDRGAYSYGGAPSLTVKTPNGGETFTGLSWNNITWESSGYFTSVSLYYSLNSGGTYSLISAGEANDGTYSWYAPAVSTTEALIRIVGVGTATITDESDAVFTITTPPPPSIDNIVPNTGANTGEVSVTVNGSGYQSGATVKLIKSGQPDINGTGVIVATTDQITCNFNLNGKATGVWDVKVTNPDTQFGTLGGGFSVNYPAPAVISVVPDNGTTSGGTGVTITGTGFRSNDYKRAIDISNSGTALSDYQVLVTLETSSLVAAGKMKSDGGDIRFFDSDQSTPLSFWLESGINSSNTRLWVKVPTIEATSNKTVYLTYGDQTLSSASSGNSTFVFFDDFSGGSIDTGKWTVVDGGAYISQQSGTLVASGGPNSWGSCGFYSAINFSRPFIFEFDHQRTGSSYMMQGLKDTGTGVDYSNLIYGGYPIYDGGGNRLRVYEDGNDRGDNKKNISSDIWQYYKFVALSTGAKYYEGDSTDSYSLYYDSSYSSEDPVKTGFVVYNQAFKWDNARVRKYAATEPTISVNSETSNLIKIYFGEVEATNVTYESSTTLVCTTPAHAAGVVSVAVRNPDGQIATSESAFTYTGGGEPDLILTREAQVTAPAGYSGGASDAVPGATIKYNIYITNQGAGESKNVVLIDKIPSYSNFKIDSATGEAVNSVQYSNDNGSSYIYTPTGTFVDPAVTNVRWNHANISSGATKQVEFSVVIR